MPERRRSVRCSSPRCAAGARRASAAAAKEARRRPRPTRRSRRAWSRIAAELRCLVCQNQTIADSNADLAVDLRRQVREMLQQGKSEQRDPRLHDRALRRLRALPAAAQGDDRAAVVRPGVLLVGRRASCCVVVLRRRSRLGDDALRSRPRSRVDPGRPRCRLARRPECRTARRPRRPRCPLSPTRRSDRSTHCAPGCSNCSSDTIAAS